MAESKRVYEPHLWQAVLTILQSLTAKLALTGIKYTAYPQTPFYLEEYGEKYIFEHPYLQHGGAGTRDNDYFNFHPGLVPKYGGNNFSITVGLRHDSLAWLHTGKATPHALFWNFVYTDSTDVGALLKFNSKDSTTTVQNYVNLPLLGGSVTSDPLGVIFVRTTGATADLSPAVIAVLNGFGLERPVDDAIKGIYPLTVIHHTYVNPDTGVAPWIGSLVTPVQIHFVAS